ncbi:MAG: YlxR family protein [Gaiellaceae bacterium]
MTVPVRTCVGCGRRAPQAELLRFVARGGRLVRASASEGRSAYLCRQASCFESAVARKAFDRALRQSVLIEPREQAIYTDDDG